MEVADRASEKSSVPWSDLISTAINLTVPETQKVCTNKQYKIHAFSLTLKSFSGVHGTNAKMKLVYLNCLQSIT